MINTEVEVRPATAGDLSSVNDIYNQYVAETHYTFDVEPMSTDARREWFTHYGADGRYRVVVAVSEGRVIGYASSSRFRAKPAYETSIETSIYLAPESVGRVPERGFTKPCSTFSRANTSTARMRESHCRTRRR